VKDLRNKVAVITGAGGGIGRGIALELAKQGCKLAVSDVKQGAAEATAKACRKLGAEARPYGLDVANRDAVKAHADEVIRDFGQVNLVINNAGVVLAATTREMTWKNVEWLMNINFWGVMHGSQIFLPHLIASGDGHVVNISSIAGLIALPYCSAYNASKFAVRGYTEALALDMKLERLPVQVSCVHPGVIKTDILKTARHDAPGATAINVFEELSLTEMTAEKAGEVIVRGIRRNKTRIMVGTDAALLEPLHRLLGIRYLGPLRWLTARAKAQAGASSPSSH